MLPVLVHFQADLPPSGVYLRALDNKLDKTISIWWWSNGNIISGREPREVDFVSVLQVNPLFLVARQAVAVFDVEVSQEIIGDKASGENNLFIPVER